MSMNLMVKAMSLKVGNPLRKLILIKLADNASDKGECWPSHQHIADQCEVSKSTVRKHIKELSESGFLRIEHRDGPKGNSSNLYYLTLHGVPSKSIGMPSDDTPPMPSDDTRTSHSLEPVIEPIDQAFDFFWQNMSLSKKAKPKGKQAFVKAVKLIKAKDPMHFAKHLVDDTATRFKNQQIGFDKMHPATYLNQSRWEDDYTVDSPQKQTVQINGGGDWAKYGEETL